MITGTGLTKHYDSKPAVQALDFEIARGEIVGLLGLNGAGKTTVLRILGCQLLPTSGGFYPDFADTSKKARP